MNKIECQIIIKNEQENSPHSFYSPSLIRSFVALPHKGNVLIITNEDQQGIRKRYRLLVLTVFLEPYPVKPVITTKALQIEEIKEKRRGEQQ